ncbi:MAG: putative acyltransferase [Bacteroidetes bacterium]|nr:putative acyltransferase [Bacteroidota bacterium]
MSINKHVPVLDSLRAVAAFSVCLFHFICTVTGFIDSNFVRTLFSTGHYGVQMFFVISGFVIPWSLFHSSYVIRNYFTFALKRLIRLEPPYIASLMLAVAHTYLRTMSAHYNGVDITPTATQIALHFGYLIPFVEGQHWIRPVYWTLAVEFQYYLSIGLLFPLIASGKIFLRILSYLIILAGPFIIKGYLPLYLPVFLYGIALFLFKAKIIGWLELVILTSVATIEIFMFHELGTFIYAGITYIAILFFSEFKSKILTFFGNISYSVYLFHSLTGLVILNYFSHIVTSPFYKFLLVLLALAVTTAASYIVYRLIELPSKRLSSRIKFRKEETQ